MHHSIGYLPRPRHLQHSMDKYIYIYIYMALSDRLSYLGSKTLNPKPWSISPPHQGTYNFVIERTEGASGPPDIFGLGATNYEKSVP
jgi:hypothetical protein